MIQWLKRLVAGRELAELDRWRSACNEAMRWLHEFADVRDALGYVWGEATVGGGNISKLRDEMRVRMNRRLAMLAPLAVRTATAADLDRMASYPPIDRDEARRRWAELPRPEPLATDWDVAERDAEEAYRRPNATKLRAGPHEVTWVDPGRVDYRFLGVTGEEA